jgi:hypothetical protein
MIDPIQLQSIVDGECTGSQRRALLAECEGKPQQWKTLALALLEEQQFRKQIALFDAKDSKANIKEDVIKQILPREEHTVEPDSSVTARPLNILQEGAIGYAGVPRGTRSPWSTWGPVLAAGVLGVMGFVGGRTFSGLTATSTASPSSDLVAGVQSNGSLKSLSPGNNPSIDLVASNDPYDGMPETDLRVRLPSSDYEIPIFDATDFDPTIALAKQEIEIQEANQRLRKQGFEIDMKPEYVMGKLQDGRQVIVPIHKVGLRQYGQ